MTIKIPDAGESESWPRGDPAILISLRPTSPPPPLMDLTHDGCHLATYVPISHQTQSHHRPISSHSEPLLRTHTRVMDIFIIISEWYDWIRSHGETEEKQKQRL